MQALSSILDTILIILKYGVSKSSECYEITNFVVERRINFFNVSVDSLKLNKFDFKRKVKSKILSEPNSAE